MRLSHTLGRTSVAFDDPNLVSAVGLVPVLALAEAAGLRDLADEHLTVPTDKGANAGLKVASLVGGMVAGADSIDDMALLRHGGMGRVFARAYAPSTLGSFLRACTFGHVRQLDAIASRFLIALAGLTRLLGASTGPAASDTGATAGYALLDVDDTIIEVHGHAKQGAGFGYSGVRGLNALLATLATHGDAHGAGDRGPTAPQGSGRVTTRREAAGQRRGEDHATTARQDPAGPGADGLGVLRPRTSPRRPDRWCCGVGHRADGQGGQEGDRHDPRRRRGPRSSTPTPYSTRPPAAGSLGPRSPRSPSPLSAAQKKSEQVLGRLVVRRIPDFNAEKHKAAGQDTLFDVWRFHAFFTTADPAILDTVAADKTHRHHAVIEQVHADLKNSALAHLPSGVFTANAAWLVLAVIAFNLTRAAGSRRGTRPRAGDHRDPAPQADHRAGTSRHLGPPDHPSPTPSLALGDRLDGSVRPGQRSAIRPRGLTIQQPPLRNPTDTSGTPRTARSGGPRRPPPFNRRRARITRSPSMPIGGSRLSGRDRPRATDRGAVTACVGRTADAGPRPSGGALGGQRDGRHEHAG